MTVEPERYVNYTDHDCGCQSRFDTLYWRSELNKPCGEHQHTRQRIRPIWASEPGPLIRTLITPIRSSEES